MAVKPLIGITASNRGSRTMTLLNRFAVWRAGGRSVVLQSRRENDLTPLDGLVVGGGDDIGADLYGGELHLSIRTDKNRDKLEMEALDLAEKKGLPVLGICRGSQMINIHRGGSLHRDVYERFEGVPRGRTILAVRHVDLLPDTLLQSLFGQDTTRINVLHHQSVDRLGEGMAVNARDRYGIVQGTELKEGDKRRYVIGVQWHPEFLVFGRKHQGLFRRLVENA